MENMMERKNTMKKEGANYGDNEFEEKKRRRKLRR